MQRERRVKLILIGGNQFLPIPLEFELSGEEVLIHREGSRLVIEPVQRQSLLAVLETLHPLEDNFLDVDEGAAS